MPALDPRARRVRHELDDTVQRNGGQRVVEDQQDREQGHAAGEAEHAGEHRGEERRGGENEELRGVQAGL